jgi:hypothetical protein
VPDFDTIKKDQLAVFTTPEDACAIFREYEKTGVTHIICMVNFGGVPTPDVRRTLELMSKEIFPRFKRAGNYCVVCVIPATAGIQITLNEDCAYSLSTLDFRNSESPVLTQES